MLVCLAPPGFSSTHANIMARSGLSYRIFSDKATDNKHNEMRLNISLVKFSLQSEFLAEDHRSGDFYFLFDGLSLEEDHQSPELKKYDSRKSLEKIGVVLSTPNLSLDVGRNALLFGGEFLRSRSDYEVWLPSYFRYYAPFHLSQNQLAVEIPFLGEIKIQATNDVLTKEPHRAEFNGSRLQPAILGQWRYELTNSQVIAQFGRYDINRSYYSNVGFSYQFGNRNHFSLDYLHHKKSIKNITNKQDSTAADWTLFNVLALNLELEFFGNLQTKLVMIVSDIESTLDWESQPDEQVSFDGMIRVSIPFWSENTRFGFSAIKESDLIPQDIQPYVSESTYFQMELFIGIPVSLAKK